MRTIRLLPASNKTRPGWQQSLLLCALLALAACSGPVQDRTVLNRTLGVEPESLDYHKARTKQAGDVQRDIGEGLTGYSATGELLAAAAESWQLSDDGLRYTFNLRKDARWSNGDVVTAEHFVYSFRRLVDPRTAAFYAQTIIDIENASEIIAGDLPPEELAVTASGEFELTVRLRQPVPYFLALLSHPSTFPVHPSAAEAPGDDYARPGRLISNGAYQLDAWQLGSVIELRRNEFYHANDDTGIDRVRHHITTEAHAELNRYRAGEVDLTSGIPQDALLQMRAERPDEVHVAPYLGVYFYGFNLKREPFKSNLKLRQALSMAIDREDITEKVTGRGETPAYSWVPPGVDRYEPRLFPYAAMSREERHAAARQLYREAGFGEDNPLQLELRYNTSQSHSRVAVAIEDMWREVLGVETSLINEEFRVLLANIKAQEITQVFLSSWLGDYNDAHTFLHLLQTDSPSNLFGYSNDDFDSLMLRSAAQTDPQRRQLYLEEAERVLLDDHPVLPIYFRVSKHLVSPRIEGWGDNVLDYHYSQHLSFSEPD